MIYGGKHENVLHAHDDVTRWVGFYDWMWDVANCCKHIIHKTLRNDKSRFAPCLSFSCTDLGQSLPTAERNLFGSSSVRVVYYSLFALQFLCRYNTSLLYKYVFLSKYDRASLHDECIESTNRRGIPKTGQHFVRSFLPISVTSYSKFPSTHVPSRSRFFFCIFGYKPSSHIYIYTYLTSHPSRVSCMTWIYISPNGHRSIMMVLGW